MPGRGAPLLPQAELLSFVKQFFAKGDRFLSLAAEQPPPFYLFDPAALIESARQFQSAFGQVFPETAFYYALKSNNHPEVARTLLPEGFGLDVSSGLELETALALGASDIIFSGPGKTDDELRLAVEHADRVVVLLDSFGELRRLRTVAETQRTVVRTGVRLTTNPRGLWRKFGIPLSELPAFWAEARDCRSLRLQGLQFHTSWNLTPEAQVAFVKLLGRALQQLPAEFLKQLEFIDMGGGYWPARGEWLQYAGTPEGHLREAMNANVVQPLKHYRMPAEPIEVFAEALGYAVSEHLEAALPCRFCFEPGRWICHDAMHLLLRVVDKKADDLVITDAGTNAIGWERFETDYFPVLNLSRPALEEHPCWILGSLCTPHDVWGYAYWGQDIQPGDLLLIPTQGAYTYSLRQNFIKPAPPVVTLTEAS